MHEKIVFAIYCYFVAVFFGGIIFGLAGNFYSYFKNESTHRNMSSYSSNDNQVYQLFILLFLLPMGIVFIIDPNTFTGGRGSSQQLNTFGRQFGWLLIFICYGAKGKVLIKDIYVRKKAFKALILLTCISAFLSGGYGFLTHTSWGLFESRYINDSFMWWAELGWCILGVIGLFSYFKYIRFWDGEEDNSDQ